MDRDSSCHDKFYSVAACRDNSPCGNLGCPKCRQGDQLKMLARYAPCFVSACDKGDLIGSPLGYAVTVVPGYGLVPIGDLEHIDLVNFRNRIARQVRTHASPGAVGLFVVDVSKNIQSEVDAEDHWQLHVHGILMEEPDE
ncbi:hypothetical protein P2H44_07525 [Albimonas sp. CAU 1670]|uniref:hypothetical protein n=1 Tax=Albimonas sp. CAU 1670 TaxID=3032599 RepID=UPI0023DBB91E|nr:hypothetical protein [Albimonas sp. CAU 1670]MDF2232402.1 hypothetical protein [Albimonas sp. CAU 1670]